MNNPIDQAVQTAVNAANADLTAFLEAYLMASDPVLALPIVRQIADYVISKVVTTITTDADNAAYAIFYKLQVVKEQAAFEAAEASGDKQAIEQAADGLIHVGE